MTLFEQAVLSTASTLRINGSPLDAAQIVVLTNFLRDHGIEAQASALLSNPATGTRLADGSIYVVYSGVGQDGQANDFVKMAKSSGMSSGTIGDTAYGTQLTKYGTDGVFNGLADQLKNLFGQDNPLQFEDAFGAVKDINGNTVLDVFWNYGSPDFIANAADNELGILGAEVDDGYVVGFHVGEEGNEIMFPATGPEEAQP